MSNLEKARTRLLSYVTREESGCWTVQVGMTSGGYARMYVDGEIDLAHRWSYRIHHGDIPEGMLVRHTCDVRNCVCPEHLIVGTQSQNILDAVERGRYVKNRGGAVLTWDDVRFIRSSPLTGAALAQRYGVHRMTISDVRNFHTWVEN